MYGKVLTDEETGQRIVFTPNGWVIEREEHEHASIVVLSPQGDQIIVPLFEAGSVAKAISALAEGKTRTYVTVEEFVTSSSP